MHLCRRCDLRLKECSDPRGDLGAVVAVADVDAGTNTIQANHGTFLGQRKTTITEMSQKQSFHLSLLEVHLSWQLIASELMLTNDPYRHSLSCSSSSATRSDTSYKRLGRELGSLRPGWRQSGKCERLDDSHNSALPVDILVLDNCCVSPQ